MPEAPISLGTQSNPGRDSHISAARLINCYPEVAGEEGKMQLPLVAIDSYAEWVDIGGAGAIRAFLAADDTTLYVAKGSSLYSVDNSKAVTGLGSIAGTGRVKIVRNQKSPTPDVLVLVTQGPNSGAGNLYLYNGSTVSSIADFESGASFINGATVSSLSMLNGYAIAGTDAGEFFVSGYQDASSWQSLDFETAEKHPDPINASDTRAGELVLFGTNSTEFYQVVANVDFPFERSASAEYGCYAPGSVCKVASGEGEATSDTLMWAASNADGSYAGVAVMNGYGRRLISNQDLDRKIEGETSKNAITAMAWTRRGHAFYAISGTSWTYTFDLRTGRWHERQSSGLSYYEPKVACQFGTTKLLGSGSSSVIYAIDDTIATTIASQAKLSFSDDGGHNYSTPRAKTAGGSTNLTQRFKWNRLGTSKEDGKVLKVEITNAFMADGVGTSMTIIPPAVHAWPKRVKFHNVRLDLVPGTSLNSRAKAVTGLSANTDLVGG